MIAKKHIALIALVTCALALPLLAKPKNGVTRPDKNHATAIWIINPVTGSGTTYQVGEGTHYGRFTAEGTGTWDLSQSPPALVSASIITTDATGGQMEWKVPGSEYQCEYIPGTATGKEVKVIFCGFNTVWMSEPEFIESPVKGAIAFKFDYRGEGIITY